jgi:MoxR-like ATPase
MATDRDALRLRALALVGCGVPLTDEVAQYLVELVERDTPADAWRAERDRLLREAGHWIGGSIGHRVDRLLALDALEDRRPVKLGDVCRDARDLVALARQRGPTPSRRQLWRILEGNAH